MTVTIIYVKVIITLFKKFYKPDIGIDISVTGSFFMDKPGTANE
jgi:hypothetical protein